MEPSSRYAENQGGKVHYLDWGGTGPTVLLLHGMRGRARLWESLAPGLAERFTVRHPRPTSRAAC